MLNLADGVDNPVVGNTHCDRHRYSSENVGYIAFANEASVKSEFFAVAYSNNGKICTACAVFDVAGDVVGMFDVF